MKTAVIALTGNGTRLAFKIGKEFNWHIYIKAEMYENLPVNERLPEIYLITAPFIKFTGDLFVKYEALVFIMACGIAVRAIAPYIKDKKSDPAVCVMDEQGKHVISLLSGHAGGANRLAGLIAGKTGGVPVITTATDINQVWAFDMLSLQNNCTVENIQDLKYISSRMLRGEKVCFYSDYPVKGIIPGNIVYNKDKEDCSYSAVLSNRTDHVYRSKKTLFIRPRNLILGIGCRKNISYEKIRTAAEDFMNMNRKSILSLRTAATIDLKQEEPALLKFCKEYNIFLQIISREVIKDFEQHFTNSDFVKKTVGVGSVAEPCAVLAGKNAKLICGKTVYEGLTLALSEEEVEFII